MASDCKVVTVRGKRRRLCWGRKRIGAHMQRVIVSNKPASGGGSKRKSTKRKASKTAAKVKYTFASKKTALYQSGKKKGKLKPGCKFVKNGRTMCSKSKRR